jgi:hypothetical protein
MILILIAAAAGVRPQLGACLRLPGSAGAALGFPPVQVGAQGLGETALAGGFLSESLGQSAIRRRMIVVVRKTHLDKTQKFRSENLEATVLRCSRKSF